MSCKKCKCKVCSCIVNEQVKIAVNKVVQNPNEKGIVDVKVPTKTSELINDSGFGQGGQGGGKIDEIRVNGVLAPIQGKTAIVSVPTKTSDLENDSDFTTTTALNLHVNSKNNPHNVTKEQIGLENVDNTSDLNKPISIVAQTELNKKLDKPVTNNTSQFVILGDGSTAPKTSFGKVEAVNGKIGDVILKTSDLENDSDYTTNSNLSLHTTNKNNPHGVTKEQLNLGNVDNTSDLNKPISTATQNALNNKLSGVKVNGENVTIEDSVAQIDIPTRTSDIENDSEYTNKDYVDSEIQRIENINFSGILGSVNPTTNVSTLQDGVYRAEVSGVYPNLGGLVVKEGYSTLLRKDGSFWDIESEVKLDLGYIETKVDLLENTSKKLDVSKFDISLNPDGYFLGKSVLHNDKLWESLDSNNKETPSETSSKWREVKLSADVDQEFDENSKNPIANDVVTKRTSLLERLEEEATEVIEGEGEIIENLNYSDFNQKFSIYRKGKGQLKENNTFVSGSSSAVVFQNIPIEANIKITIKITNQTSASYGSVYFSARKKNTEVWETIISEYVSTSTNIVTESIYENEYDLFSIMVYENSSVFNYKVELLDGLIIKFDKDYLYNKLNQSGSYANPIGELVDITTISLPSGYTTFYYPWIITTENIVNPKGKYYLYFSTDHDTDANGKIGMFYSDNLVDWIFHGNIITSSSFGGLKQPETPCVIWNEELKKYLMYFHVSSDYGVAGYSQTTLIAESVDGLNFSYVKPAFNITMNKMKGDGHNGYFVCQKINGIYKGVSLFGGTDIDFRGVHFSKDGLNWITHQKESQGVNTTSYFWRQNALCRIATADVVTENEAGGVAGSYRKFTLTYFDENLEILGGGDIIGNILQSGEPQVVSSMATNIIDGQIYLSAVYSKTKIVIKKLN